MAVLSGEDADQLRVIVSASAYRLAYAATRNSVLDNLIQFRGASDAASSLGQLGFVVNAPTNASASSRFALQQPDLVSTINGASPSGLVSFLGPFTEPVLRVHAAQIGLADPYTEQLSGPILAATPGMARVTWDVALNVRALMIVEGPPTNFAGAAGTGSARNVSIVGLAYVG